MSIPCWSKYNISIARVGSSCKFLLKRRLCSIKFSGRLSDRSALHHEMLLENPTGIALMTSGPLDGFSQSGKRPRGRGWGVYRGQHLIASCGLLSACAPAATFATSSKPYHWQPCHYTIEEPQQTGQQCLSRYSYDNGDRWYGTLQRLYPAKF